MFKRNKAVYKALVAPRKPKKNWLPTGRREEKKGSMTMRRKSDVCLREVKGCMFKRMNGMSMRRNGMYF